MAYIGRSSFYNNIPGLDSEIDRIYKFLEFIVAGVDPKEIGKYGKVMGGSEKNAYFTGKAPMRGIRIGEGTDSALITEYIAIDPDDAERVVGANSNLYYSVTDSDFDILGEIQRGTTVTLYRDPWDDDLQLTHSIVWDSGSDDDGQLNVRLTNDTGAGITIASGKWYVTLINHRE